MKIRTVLTILIALAVVRGACAQPGAQLRFCLGAQPGTFDPLMAVDEPSGVVRYLTGGVLLRLNRKTQQLEPELATSWKVGGDGRTIAFTLRPNVRFSDGSPFSADDVAYTMQRLMDPALHSPAGDSFRIGEGKVSVQTSAGNRIVITFPAAIVGLDRLFDQVAIQSAHSSLKEKAVLGPYFLAENKAGSFLLLRRNPYYWKRDEAGHQLPYLDSIRLDIQQNRDIEMLRLTRGEIDFISALSAENYENLRGRASQMAVDAGVGLGSEQLWFNQVPTSPIETYKKAWFASTAFRRAISSSIHRDDIVRVVYRGYARPAVSWVSPANKAWFNDRLQPHRFDRQAALEQLQSDGFRLDHQTLRDRGGHPVEFSLITNAGNKDRENMAAMIQQDLEAIGIRLNVITLDFPSLIERITRSFNYEACLLGFVNDELDPNAQMNVWLSSAENHQWNPGQKSPATAWEAEIDRLMRTQATALDFKKRKAAVDRVQQIVWEQEPFIYLVNKDVLMAVSPNLHNVSPVALEPHVFWNIDRLTLGAQVAARQ